MHFETSISRTLNGLSNVKCQKKTFILGGAVCEPCRMQLRTVQFSECAFKVVMAPSYLSTMCQPVADNAGRRHLRSAARGDLAVPATRTVRYTVLAASLLQDRPCGTTFQYCYTQLPPSILVPSRSEN